MDSGFRVLREIDSSRKNLKKLADAAIRERISSGAFLFLKQRLRVLWLYAMQASSVDAVMLHLMTLIGGSPRDQRWRRDNIGQRVLDDLKSAVRQISQEIAHDSDVDWEPGFWLVAARTYLSYLWQSHTFEMAESSGPARGPGPTEIESDGASGS